MGCHDAPMSERSDDASDDPVETSTDTEAPGADAEPGPVPIEAGPDDGTSMRLAGFGLTALGGLLIGVGALLPWIRSGIEGMPAEFAPTYYGIDMTEGVIALAAGIVVLVALAITRLATSPRARRGAAGAVIVASFVAVAVAGAALVTAAERFESTVVDDVMGDLPSDTADGVESQIRELIDTSLAAGPFAVVGGGMLGVLGGLLLLAWASKARGEGTGAEPGRELEPPPEV